MAGVPGAAGGGHGERRGAVAGGARAAAPGVRFDGIGGAGADSDRGAGPPVGGGAQGRGYVGRSGQNSVPDEREPKPGRVSAYEESLKSYADRRSDVVINPVIGMSFDSCAEAFEFYNLHSWEVGFGIRWNNITENTDKSVLVQEIVCSCQGKPELSNTPSVQTDCTAMIRLRKSDDNGWYILEVQGDHNHPLSGTCSENLSWPSHKHLMPYTKNIVRRLRDNNVDLSKMRPLIYSFFRDMKNILFNERALMLLCEWISVELDDDDDDAGTFSKLFDDFGSLKRDDPSFQFRIELDDIKTQFKMLWTNGSSRTQYAHFGDVITFDTTYRSKLYDIPFGLFVGVNNHYQSVILGGVLMQHQTVECFKWVFREFITLMGGKAPSTILTGQCHAMEVAIQEVLPDTTHKWCKLHVLSKENEFIGPICSKKSGFMDEFQKITDSMLTVREFESAWQHLLDKYNLHGNAFLSQVYDSRHKWAKPYFKGKFCAKQTSMQRNECADHLFKGYVPLDRSIKMFVQHYNKIQSDLDSKESFEEDSSRKTPRVMSKGVPIEEHAAKIYTRAMFEKFDEIIFQSGSYVVVEKEKGKAYLARHIRNNCLESWSQVEFEVTIRAEDGAVICECGFWEHIGLPCCHAVKVMIHLGMQEIPAGNIVKRWTIDARDISPAHLMEHENDWAAGSSQSDLFLAALEVVKTCSKSDNAFRVGLAHLDQLTQELLELAEAEGKDVSGLSEQCGHSATQGSDVQYMPAATTDDATLTARKRRAEAEGPDIKRKIVQHAQAKGPR